MLLPAGLADEALVFKQYDSRNAAGTEVLQCPHIAFHDDGAPADAPPRRSVEVRVCCAFQKDVTTTAATTITANASSRL